MEKGEVIEKPGRNGKKREVATETIMYGAMMIDGIGGRVMRRRVIIGMKARGARGSGIK